jgi:hypothetical protein
MGDHWRYAEVWVISKIRKRQPRSLKGTKPRISLGLSNLSLSAFVFLWLIEKEYLWNEQPYAESRKRKADNKVYLCAPVNSLVEGIYEQNIPFS